MRYPMSLTLLLVSVISVAQLPAGDLGFEPLDERGLKKAEAHLIEHDYRNGLKILFMILRNGERDLVRSEARERLEKLGLSTQNIFQLEIEAMKSSELEELFSQVATSVASNARRDTDLYCARQLLASSLILRTDSEGAVKADIATKDTLAALKILLDYALGENIEGMRKGQAILEAMGISGKKVEAAKQSVRDDKLLPEVAGEIIPAAAVARLQLHYAALKDARDADDASPRRKVAREMGTAILQYIDKEFPDSSVLRRHNDAVDFFRDKVAPGKVDKF